MRLIHFLSFSFCVMLLLGCRERPIFSKNISIDGTWNYNKELAFPFEINQLDLTYDLVLSLTYGTDFGYQNIYVKIITLYPKGEKKEDILSLNLTDGSGIFLGDCNSSRCKVDILLQEKFKFKEEGNYEITIIQNGRNDNLEGVYEAELKLFKNMGTIQ